jgi:Novel STAND NTPase 1/WD domain, G-beta repeat
MAGAGVIEVNATYTTYLSNPFRGPNPLREGDPIFGRDGAIQRLFDQLLSDRLVLLHAISGCGKTSLVEAGLRPLLEGTFTPFPTINMRRSANTAASASALISKLAASFAPHIQVPLNLERVDKSALSAMIEALSECPGNLTDHPSDRPPFNFLFFDQFEEVLSDKQLSEGQREMFFRSLGLLLERRNTWALFAIREDYLGAMQPYLHLLPTQLSSRFRLTRFSVEEAVLAIQMEKKDEDNITRLAFTPEAAAHLASDLGVKEDSAASVEAVEPVHLQVVCDYLWRKCGRHPIELEDLGKLDKRLASVTSALAEYYKDTLQELAKGNEDIEFKLRSWFENSLIDNRERRNRVRISPDSTEVTAVQLEFLKERYLIRDDQPSAPAADRVVELAHDRLILPVIENNRECFGKYRQAWLEAAVEYSKKPAPSLLLCRQALNDAEKWAKRNQAKLQPFHTEFLTASRAHERRRTQMRWLIFVAICAIAIAVTAWVRAGRSMRQSESDKIQAARDTQQARRDVLDAQRQVKIDHDRLAAIRAQMVSEQAQHQRDLQQVQRREDEARKQLEETKAATASAIQEAKLTLEQQAAETNKAKNEKAAADREMQHAQAETQQLSHLANAVQAVSVADQNRDLSQAVFALREAQRAVAAGFKQGDKSADVVQRAAVSTRNLLFDMFLQERLCIRGYFQSFAVGGMHTVAVDEAGHYYDDTLTTLCPDSPPAIPQPLVPYPSASAIVRGDAKGQNLVVLGTHRGQITISKDGVRPAENIDFHEPIVALSLSPNGEFLGASSALWSVSVWRLSDANAKRVLRWPGSLWNPASWVKWLSIVGSNTNQITNALAIHLGGEPSGNGQVGIMAAAQDDGRIKIVPVNGAPHHSTKVLTILNSKFDSGIVAVRFSSDGQLLAAGSRAGVVWLWDLTRNSPAWTDGSDSRARVVVSKWKEDQSSRSDDTGDEGDSWCGGSVTSLEFVANQGRMLAVGCQNGTTHLYDIDKVKFGTETRQEFAQLEIFRGWRGGAKILHFDAATNLLYATGPSPYVDVWNIPPAASFKLHSQLQDQLIGLEKAAAHAKNADELVGPIDAVTDNLCKLSKKSLDACKSK